MLRRGEGGGLCLATTGVGVKPPELQLGTQKTHPVDAIPLSGPVGDHGTAVLLAREQFGLRGDLVSVAASVLPLAQALTPLPGLRFMRDWVYSAAPASRDPRARTGGGGVGG